jgi:hypothetical protein
LARDILPPEAAFTVHLENMDRADTLRKAAATRARPLPAGWILGQPSDDFFVDAMCWQHVLVDVGLQREHKGADSLYGKCGVMLCVATHTGLSYMLVVHYVLHSVVHSVPSDPTGERGIVITLGSHSGLNCLRDCPAVQSFPRLAETSTDFTLSWHTYLRGKFFAYLYKLNVSSGV